MTANLLKNHDRLRALVLISASVAVAGVPAAAQNGSTYFSPGNLVVSRSVYDNNPNNVRVGQILPPNCQATQGGCAGPATNDGTYPTVFNNDLVDASFGITSKIFPRSVHPGRLSGEFTGNSQQRQRRPHAIGDQLVTSFSSKSELALNLSTDGQYLTFMGYVAPIDDIDVSNSNTNQVVDPTNPVGRSYYRAVAQIDVNGNATFTQTNAYSGNNGRAAILNNSNGADFFYTAGNAGNGANPQPDGIIIGAGAQILNPLTQSRFRSGPDSLLRSRPSTSRKSASRRTRSARTTISAASPSSTTCCISPRAAAATVSIRFTLSIPRLTVCNDNNGIGLPPANATLPTAPLAYDPSVLQTKGLDPNNMCILNGFPTALKSKTSFPFGVWFADANTLYVADEGDGDNTYANGVYTKAAGNPLSGLQKWIFDPVAGQWNLAYVLQSGLQLGMPYTVPNYPTGNNPATGCHGRRVPMVFVISPESPTATAR